MRNLRSYTFSGGNNDRTPNVKAYIFGLDTLNLSCYWMGDVNTYAGTAKWPNIVQR